MQLLTRTAAFLLPAGILAYAAVDLPGEPGREGAAPPPSTPHLEGTTLVGDSSEDAREQEPQQAPSPVAAPQPQEVSDPMLAKYGELDLEGLQQAYRSQFELQHALMREEFDRQIEDGRLAPGFYANTDELNASQDVRRSGATGFGVFALRRVTSNEDGTYSVYVSDLDANDYDETRALSEELSWLKRRIHDIGGPQR